MQLKFHQDPAADIEERKAQYVRDCKEQLQTEPTFCKRATVLMGKAGWDYNEFETRTTIDRKIYYRIRNGELESPEFETVLKICIGIGLRQRDRDELLRLSGHCWQNTVRHFYYQRILEDFNIESPSAFNDAYALFCPDDPPPFKYDGR